MQDHVPRVGSRLKELALANSPDSNHAEPHLMASTPTVTNTTARTVAPLK